jgi:hypothetical protein
MVTFCLLLLFFTNELACDLDADFLGYANGAIVHSLAAARARKR